MTPAQDLIVSTIVVSLLLSLLVGFMISFAFLYQKRRFQYQREKSALREAYEREILQTQLEIQNDTLQRVGEELHDNLGQLLTLARLHLNQAGEAPDETRSKTSVKQANDVLKSAIQAVRTLSKTLDGGTVHEFGLVESLSLECERIRRMGTVQVEFRESGEMASLSPQAELVLFRMVQEVLNNALKHAEATALVVSVHGDQETFSLTITDTGKGFDPALLVGKTLAEGGSGLRNLHRRAELLGGTFTLHSQPGAGTRVEIRIPRAGTAAQLPGSDPVPA